jgi:hypothetical protein
MGEDSVGWDVVAEAFYQAEAAILVDLEKTHDDAITESTNSVGTATCMNLCNVERMWTMIAGLDGR